MAFPLSQGQMEDWGRGQGFIKESDIADYLREQRFVTENKLRSEGYASGGDVRQTVVQLVQDEQSQFEAIRAGIQALLESTHALSTSFSDRVSTATTDSPTSSPLHLQSFWLETHS